MRKEFGKPWSNEDIDNVIAANYYIKYVFFTFLTKLQNKSSNQNF